MTQEKLREIRALREQLKELDFDKKVLEAKLQALSDSDRDSSFSGAPVSAAAPTDDDNDGDVVNGLYVAERPSDAESQVAVYRRVVAARTGWLPLRGIAPARAKGSSSSAMMALSHLYVGLATDLSVPESVISTALKAALRGEYWPFPLPQKRRVDDADVGEQRPVTAMEAAILRRSQVLLGAPGSGKTTFVNYLAYALATKDPQSLGGWPARERVYLPILVRLRDFAAWIRVHGGNQEASASLLWGFVLHDMRERNLGFIVDLLHTSLENGEVLLLLDGLDEVPAAVLPSVRDSVEDCGTRYASCRILVTCRTIAYEQPDRQLSDQRFPKTRLCPFDAQRIERFIDNWYIATAGEGRDAASLSLEKVDVLRVALNRPNLRRSASNPMLLTVMALVQSARSELPETRYSLYEEAVRILLWHWELADRSGEPCLSDLLHVAQRDRSDLIALLERLSYEISAGMQADDDTDYEEGDLVAGISEQDLIAALRQLHPQKHLNWGQAVADTLKLRSGLLMESQPGVFHFLHSGFREYLAGAYVAHFLDFPERVANLVSEWAVWHEIILQAVGFLVQNQREIERPMLLAERLCPSQAPADDIGWRQVWLAGEVLLEIGLSRVCDTKRGIRLREQVSHRLAALVERGALRARERAQVGDVLGTLGDGRFDRSRFHLPSHFRGEKEKAMGLVTVKSGGFIMGSQEDDRDAERDEVGNPPEVMIDYRYWISRYPVTVAEFAGFVRAGGYDSADYWTESGRKWLREQDRREPDGWADQSAFRNRPVVGVSWYEATAFARWLDAQLRRRTGHVPENYEMRLPTEAEWEKAARGSDGRRYPWGKGWEDGRANVAEEVGGAATVGIFPEGGTPSGIQDLSGNVWEWCLNAYRLYPYGPSDGRTAADARGMRVLRGGAWNQGPRSARCACRLARHPGLTGQDAGFRLVLSIAGLAI